MKTVENVRASIINGIIVLTVDENVLLTMKTMTLAEYSKMEALGKETFRTFIETAVKNRFEEVSPSFQSETDRADAMNLMIAKLGEKPGSTGIQATQGAAGIVNSK